MVTLDQRLQVLERELNRSRRINRTLVLAIVVVACIAGAQSNPPDESKTPKQAPLSDARPSDVGHQHGADRLRTIEAERFVLLDRRGRSRIRIQVTDDGPAISMFDEEGQRRLELSQTNTASGLRLFDASNAVVSLQLHDNGGPAHLEIKSELGSSTMKPDGFSVRDASDRGRAHLSLLNGNFPSLRLSDSDQNGPPSIEMTAGEEERSFKIHDSAGLPIFSVFATDNGDSFLNMRHPEHDRSLQISTRPNDHKGPIMAFFAPANEDGTGGLLPRLQIGLDKDCQPQIRIAE